MTTRAGAAVALGIGVAAIVVAAAFGAVSDALVALATPPPLVRAALVGVSAVLGAYLLVFALRRIEEARDHAGPGVHGAATDGVTADGAAMSTAQLGTMVRGIRFIFLAAAAFAAGIGWLAGHPLPIVIGLVIAGVDLAETSFLLLVASARGT